MTLHETCSDGAPIPMCDVCQTRKAIHKNMVCSRWEKGDLLMTDNFSTSHGRQPTHDKGGRNPIEKKNVVVSLLPSFDESTKTMSGCDPQECKTTTNSGSTMTMQDSQQLHSLIHDNECKQRRQRQQEEQSRSIMSPAA